jgi:hypothetical protein
VEDRTARDLVDSGLFCIWNKGANNVYSRIIDNMVSIIEVQEAIIWLLVFLCDPLSWESRASAPVGETQRGPICGLAVTPPRKTVPCRGKAIAIIKHKSFILALLT